MDQNGKTKTVLKGLLLSKERECYKGIDKQQEIANTQYSREQYQNTSQEQSLENNLPVKQNRFSRFFSQMRSRFAKQPQNRNVQRRNLFSRKKDNIQQYEEPQRKVKEMKHEEKKPWELEPEEKAKIQRETAEIAKRHREQEEQQKQAPLQQEAYQNSQNIAQSIQQQIPEQQPPIDMGGMEL